MYVGELRNLSWTIIEEELPHICADLEMVTNLCKSLTSGIHTLEEVTEYMRWMFTREHPAADAHMASNKQNYEHNEVPLDTKISLLYPNQKDQEIEKQYHKSASLIMRDDLPLPGNVYLCTIQSRSGSVLILVNPLSSPTGASCLRLTLVRILSLMKLILTSTNTKL